jgi:hypothetical protein
MTEKLKFFKIVIFATDAHRFSGQEPYAQTRQMEVMLPTDAISHLTIRNHGNPQSGYNIHIKKNYPIDAPFPIKSYNPGYLTNEQVEILKLQ